ncbi:hypothetical protein JHK87_027621 [Glycine soja]|nr:hypothetical protein JHK87_027621 [Glycine soja]
MECSEFKSMGGAVFNVRNRFFITALAGNLLLGQQIKHYEHNRTIEAKLLHIYDPLVGKKPEALYKVDNTEVRQFVEKCLATVSLKLSARELLDDPFLQIYDYGFDSKVVQYQRHFYEVNPLIRQPLNGIYSINNKLISGDTDNVGGYGPVSELDYHRDDFEASEIGLFGFEEDDNLVEVDTTIKGRREDDGIFLTLRIADKEGLKLKPTHFASHINKYSTPSREREGFEPIPSSEE